MTNPGPVGPASPPFTHRWRGLDASDQPRRSTTDRATVANRPGSSERAWSRRVVDVIEVAGRRQHPDRTAQPMQPTQLSEAGVRLAHRDALEHLWVDRGQPDHPEAAIGRQPDRVTARCHRAQGLAEPPTGDRSVHPDHHPRTEVGEAVGQSFCQPVAALGHHVVPVGYPLVRSTVEEQHTPDQPHPRRHADGRIDGIHRVGQRRGSDLCRLLRRAGRAQSGLHATGFWRLGDDRRVHGPSSVASVRNIRPAVSAIVAATESSAVGQPSPRPTLSSAFSTKTKPGG